MPMTWTTAFMKSEPLLEMAAICILCARCEREMTRCISAHASGDRMLEPPRREMKFMSDGCRTTRGCVGLFLGT
jgi:hypothetical protein